MARDTIYKLYKTGRIDPTYSNIWAFASSIERDTYLQSKASLTLQNQKYWRVGEPIKIPIRYEMAFEYDYVRISNDTQDETLARNWYCFIVARAYISPGVTLLTLAVDYIQSFYFTSGQPFWKVNGFVQQSTFSDTLPPVGTPPDYPVPNISAISEIHNDASEGYAAILYASIAPNHASSSTPQYTSAIIDGVPMAAPPYVLYSSNPATLLSTLVSTVNNYNTYGWTDTISGIYLVPAGYIAAAGKTGNWVAGSTADLFIAKTVELTVPDYTTALGEYNDLIVQYGYFNFIINNGQGETAAYNFNEFNEAPRFSLYLSVSSGSPCLMCIPQNLKYKSSDWRDHIIKITQAPNLGWLNDSYKIWLAQTQNSRAASIDGANLAIAQAKEAREKSWAYQSGEFIKDIEERGRALLPGLMADLSGGISAAMGNDRSTRGSVAGRKFGDVSIPYGDEQQLTTPTYGSQYGTDQQVWRGIYDVTVGYINNQLGVEKTYQYDQAVASAQQQLNQLLASYTDKARIPATTRGSNAYGDTVKFQQYGFMFVVFGPDAASLTLIYNMLKAGGFTTNTYMQITKHHTVFDYVKANSVKIPANATIRPEFVRKMMLDMLQSGVYLWYVSSGDISEYIGSPYGVTNSEVS